MVHARRGNAAHSSHAGFAHPPRNVAALGIREGSLVADFGSGSGAYVLAIAEQLQGGGTVYAVDVQKDLLRRTQNEAARRGFKNVEILWGDLEAKGGSKIADDTLDLVLISNLLFQVDDKTAVVKEAVRVVQSGGRVAIIDWEDSFNNLGPTRDDVVTKKDAFALCRDAGLTFVSEFPAGAHHYGLLFTKKL